MLLGKRKERDEGDEENPVYNGDVMEESDNEKSLTHAPNQVLPIANLPADFSGAPQDGTEYLFTVRWAYIPLYRSRHPFDLRSSRTDTDCAFRFTDATHECCHDSHGLWTQTGPLLNRESRRLHLCKPKYMRDFRLMSGANHSWSISAIAKVYVNQIVPFILLTFRRTC